MGRTGPGTGPIHRYVEAARPRTLPAAVAPVLVGTAAASLPVSGIDPVRAALAQTVAVALQVGVNYANDYFDGVKGVDTAARGGPRRAVASGLIEPRAMRTAMVVAVGVGCAAGLALSWLAGWELILVGLLAVFAVLGYSGGRHPYASRGLGEVSVFVFFGFVATIGAQYVQDERIGRTAVLASVPMGMIACALLVANNLRDIPTDAAVGKRTLAVRLGERRSRRLFAALLVLSLVWLIPISVAVGSPWPMLAILSGPLALAPLRTVARAPLGPALIPVLAGTGRFQLVYAGLVAVGLVAVGPFAQGAGGSIA